MSEYSGFEPEDVLFEWDVRDDLSEPGRDAAAGLEEAQELLESGRVFKGRRALIEAWLPDQDATLWRVIAELWALDAQVRTQLFDRLASHSGGLDVHMLEWTYDRRADDLRRLATALGSAGRTGSMPSALVFEEETLRRAVDLVGRDLPGAADGFATVAEVCHLRMGDLSRDPGLMLNRGEFSPSTVDRIDRFWEDLAIDEPATGHPHKSLLLSSRYALDRILRDGPEILPELIERTAPPSRMSDTPGGSVDVPRGSADAPRGSIDPRLPMSPPDYAEPAPEEGGPEEDYFPEDVATAEPPDLDEAADELEESDRVENLPTRGGGRRGAMRGGRRRGSRDDRLATRSRRRGSEREDVADAAEGGDVEDAPDQETWERTPHMDLSDDGPLAPEMALEVTIYADREAARAGERSANIELIVPKGIKETHVEVMLTASSHFKPLPPRRGFLRVARDEGGTNRLTFPLKVRDAAGLEEVAAALRSTATITASFSHDGRPSGYVERQVSIDLPDHLRGDEDLDADVQGTDGGTMQVDIGARRPDLIVQVRMHPDRDGKKFFCRVIRGDQPPEIPDSLDPVDCPDSVAWNFNAKTGDLVREMFDGFVNEGSAVRRLASLRGAGRRLFAEACPDNFKKIFWAEVAAGTSPASIWVVSEEPHIPWELMIPRPKGGKDLEPLGVMCNVSRWFPPEGVSPPQVLPLGEALTIAPELPDHQEKQLPHAEREAFYVRGRFGGDLLRPAFFDELEGDPPEEPVSLIHICCHGEDKPDLDDGGELLMQEMLWDDGPVSTQLVDGSYAFETLLSGPSSLVFLNACEVGRETPSFVGSGGFASSFITLGAKGVIAALWSVKDDLSHDVARAFYEAVEEDRTRPYSEILQQIRAQAYDGDHGAEDTFAAYCFYGDPLAAAQAPVD